MKPLFAFAMLALLVGCSQKPAENTAQTANADSFFAKEIAPILQNNCATCHLTGAEAGKMSLVPANAIAHLVNIKVQEAPNLVRVVPGNPDASYLIMKLEGTHIAHGGTGARMPFGAPPLSAEKIANFRRWIREGAQP